MHRSLPFLAALAVVLAGPDRVRAQVSDQDLSELVAETIRDYPHYGVFDSVDVAVEDRMVTLAGRVTNPAKRSDIGRRVQQIDGVRSLANEIGVLPVSQADNDLRYRVARAIYNHPTFWIYGQMPVPPIHIVVERGRITLTGLADSEAQRSLAASLAQVDGSFGVTNRIKVERRR